MAGSSPQPLHSIPSAEAATRPAFLCLSSGTTGPAKAVSIPHQNLTSNIQQQSRTPILIFSPSTVYVTFTPHYHIGGVILNILRPFFRGSLMLAMPRFDLELYLSLMQRYKATLLSMVPPVALLLARSPLVEKYDLSSIERAFCTTAPLPMEIRVEFEARMKKLYGKDILLFQAYGSTETSPFIAQVPYWREDKRHTSGCLVPNLLMRHVDPETLNDIPKQAGATTPGEIWVKGPNVTIGYYRNEAATNAAFAGGWCRTGDLALVDSDGFLTIVDRIKEMIKYKGIQVVPSELENKILQHPSAQDVAVVGLWKEADVTEVPVAFIVLQKDGMRPRNEVVKEVRRWFNGEVANHQKLRGGIFELEEIPKSASGKILRRELRDMAPSRLQGSKL